MAAFGLGKYLRRKGHDVAFLGFQHIGAQAYVKLDSEYVPMIEGNNTLSMERGFKEWKPDVGIHIRDAFAHTRWFGAPYSFMAMKGKPKIILWTPVQNDGLPPEFVDACNKECDLCVSLTDWGKEVLLFQGVPYNHLEAIPIGYDPEVMHPRQVKKEDYGFSGDKPLIGSVGINDQHRKGWPILLEAVSILKKKVDVDLYLHTSPEGSFNLPIHASHYGLKGQITYPIGYNKTWGPNPDLFSELINCFDVYASASIEEGQNVPLLEALACGKRVVCTDMPNHREVMGEYALYARSTKNFPTPWGMGWLADPQDMARQLEFALSTGPTPADQAEYVNRFSWEMITERWLEILRKHAELGVKL